MTAPTEDRDRIPVARPRPSRHARSGRVSAGASGIDAGATLIVVIAIFATAGIWAGGAIGAPLAGGLIGGLAGLLAGFAAVYTRYRDL